MRLKALDEGHSRSERVYLGFIRRMGGDPPDVVKTLAYRPDFWGKRFSRALHQIMRRKSDWTRGERELFAAYTSRLNQCVF
jgi:hypothetical protein